MNNDLFKFFVCSACQHRDICCQADYETTFCFSYEPDPEMAWLQDRCEDYE